MSAFDGKSTSMKPVLLCTFGPTTTKEAEVLVRDKTASARGAYRGSFTRGGGMLTGYLGEVLLAKYMAKIGVPLVNVDTRHCDFTAPNGSRLEVKTKATTAHPRDNYANSVCAWNTQQQADWYVFLRVQLNPGTASGCLYFCGATPCAEFRSAARKVEKGAVSPSNGFVASATHFSMPMSACVDMAGFVAAITVDGGVGPPASQHD